MPVLSYSVVSFIRNSRTILGELSFQKYFCDVDIAIATFITRSRAIAYVKREQSKNRLSLFTAPFMHVIQ